MTDSGRNEPSRPDHMWVNLFTFEAVPYHPYTYVAKFGRGPAVVSKGGCSPAKSHGNGARYPGITEMLQNLTECREFD